MHEFSKRTTLIAYGVFCAVMAGILIILISTALLAKGRWVSGLKMQVSEVLEEKLPGAYTVGENVPVRTPFAAGAACYKLTATASAATTGGRESYGIILRIMTIYGPAAAVYVYAEPDHAVFVGFANMHNAVADHMEQISKNSSITYWADRIPAILRLYDEGAVSDDN